MLLKKIIISILFSVSWRTSINRKKIQTLDKAKKSAIMIVINIHLQRAQHKYSLNTSKIVSPTRKMRVKNSTGYPPNQLRKLPPGWAFLVYHRRSA